MSSTYLIYGVIALIAIFLIVSIVKKLFKLIIFLLVILLGVSLYNVFVKGVSPLEEIKSYKTDIQYGKNIKDYSSKIKTSLDNLKKVVDEKKFDENAFSTIKTENENLHKYKTEAEVLKHSDKLNFFHDKYCGYLNSIVNTADTALELGKLKDNSMITALENIVEKISSTFKELNKLQI
ncbi:hypothetical protein OW763_12295 [Clostridium aestuarii]|uniref:Uncharacterized protein n=1 Tax=Clostridium aestuarii TaxID=338193 RepID=A0ABT4D1J4_9CLOT|nr:hypothetical protein [Clostridium aestuarii]MCY6485118.1 hypothetical protein [Clostridium aestuarii]